MTPSEASMDKISALQDNAIDNIMTRLPIHDAARMSILSKKWRNHWLRISNLEFDIDFDETVSDDDKWYNAITNVLEHHQGTLTGFGVTITSEAESCPDIRPWIQTVSRKGVKQLAILSHRWVIPMPSHLFSCEGLESFYVSYVTMCPVPAGFMGFRSLTVLNLDEVEFEPGTFEIFIACCPVLEKLELLSCEIDEPIIIDLPNLTDLTIEGAYECIRLKDTSNLVSLSLGLSLDEDEILEITDEWPLDLMKFVASSCKLEKLILHRRSCEIFAKGGVSRILPTTFEHMKHLSLDIRAENQDGFFCGLDVLRSCPNIESLNINLSLDQRSANNEEPNAVGHDGGETYTLKPMYSDKGEPNYTVFYNLKEVIICYVGLVEIELQLVAIVLSASPSLEELTFDCKCGMKFSARSEVRRRICEFQRTSEKLKIVYISQSGSRVTLFPTPARRPLPFYKLHG